MLAKYHGTPYRHSHITLSEACSCFSHSITNFLVVQPANQRPALVPINQSEHHSLFPANERGPLHHPGPGRPHPPRLRRLLRLQELLRQEK